MGMANHNIKNKTQRNIPKLVVIFDKCVCLNFYMCLNVPQDIFLFVKFNIPNIDT